MFLGQRNKSLSILVNRFSRVGTQHKLFLPTTMMIAKLPVFLLPFVPNLYLYIYSIFN